MVSTDHSTTTQSIDVDSTDVQSVAPAVNKLSRARLYATWEMVDNKLVCKWRSAD